MRSLLVVALVACTREPFGSLPVGQSRVVVKDVPQARPPALDLLFVIDDSPAMTGFRADLLTNAATIGDGLARLVDLRVAVTTAGCDGDGGVLRRTPAVDGDFIVATPFADGTRETNVADTLGHALAALVDVGATGCAVAQPLAAAKRALADHPSFLRDDAYLAIVVITASDDGSPETLADYVAWFRGVKRDPNTVIVAGVAGAAVCTYDGATAADAVRLRQFLDLFPNRSSFTTICQHDFSDGLLLVSQPLTIDTIDPCLDKAIVADRCIVTDQVDGRDIATLSSCPGDLPCVRFVDDANCGPGMQSIRVDRHEFAPLGDLVHIECEVE